MPFDNTTYPETESQLERDLRILRAAREGISKPGGWCQGVIENNWGSRCAIGWLSVASGKALTEPLDETVRRLLVPVLPRTSRYVTSFNDWPGRRKADVVALFDRAIARLERERDA